ncbi:LysE family translocator [Bosea sp. 117]|uniref:LysE family translocator n=1 Tax=Bosea sp. 117 TaxID=1125973 RepID=UPI000494D8E6|nr:LysE family translocator [Bosea sp. 117]
MTHSLVSLVLFAIAGAFTPGPNNLISTASGAAFGFRRTLPQIWGVALGFPLMIVAIGFGLGGLFATFPQLHLILKFVGSAYLLYLAWKIATASDPEASAIARPLTLLEAALFQWVNPKAWTLALGVVPAFTTIGGNLFAEVMLIALVMGATTFPALSLWAGFGVAMARLLSRPRQRRIVNLVMAALVAASVGLLFI